MCVELYLEKDAEFWCEYSYGTSKYQVPTISGVNSILLRNKEIISHVVYEVCDNISNILENLNYLTFHATTPIWIGVIEIINSRVLTGSDETSHKESLPPYLQAKL